MIYLDHNATTPVDERVAGSMLPFIGSCYGNPSSAHQQGRAARAAIDLARQQVAALVNAHPEQVIFTSGGTEANNLALKGLLACHEHADFAISAVEHASVMEPARALQYAGHRLHALPVNCQGVVDMQAVQALLSKRPQLVSVMMANNETGVMEPVEAISDQVRAVGGIMHTDAVQAVAKVTVDFQALRVHMMTLSAHKLYGPKGVGALVVDRNLRLVPMIHGGGHEYGYRAGTENVAGIVGFGAAAALAMQELECRHDYLLSLRRRLEKQLTQIDGLSIIAADSQRLANTVAISVAGISGETLLMNLDREGIAVSSGSACASHQQDPSHVLVAMGITEELARSSIRISLGKDNTADELDCFASRLGQQINSMKKLAVTGWV